MAKAMAMRNTTVVKIAIQQRHTVATSAVVAAAKEEDANAVSAKVNDNINGTDNANAIGALASLLTNSLAMSLPASSDHKNSQINQNNTSTLSWNSAVASAERILINTTASANSLRQTASPLLPSGSVINASELLGSDLALLTSNIRRLLGSDHPVLKSVATYYFSSTGGKHIRPMLVLLIAHATSHISRHTSTKILSNIAIDSPISPNSKILFEKNQQHQSAVSNSSAADSVLPAQRRLAEITEMIHTASLLHDDVIDASLTRRSKPSVNAEYGNKMAVLAGDFLLGRASVALSRLRNVEVVELLSTVISNLVEGEFMQLRNSALKKNAGSATSVASGNNTALASPTTTSFAPSKISRQFDSDIATARFEYYLTKTYMKTASLIANSCKASALLGGCDEAVADAVYRYGRALGLAFQIVDDMLDFTVTADEMGKPVNADVKLGIATAPVLYAAQEFAELDFAIERGFKEPGDDALAIKLVHASNGIERTRQLAAAFCAEAIEAIDTVLPNSDSKTALIQITQAVLTRKN
ncbi:coq1 putative hexaprenyl diphosphate synthase [Physocladia obscura]|uniref:Coq1 putative hexaprenyl diphosphate synthase n=1 Tax=Physocladia obscura TaxID=109957 RepID=A0AAD5SUB8_9FUNG|nr:coq1 putative hexaprenyl diphosphate synthase [Physocladia obscura]